MDDQRTNVEKLAMKAVWATKCRIAIGGMPIAGKSTLAKEFGDVLGVRVQATDGLTDLDWSGASREVVVWMSKAGPWIIEGCTVGRALRKWSEEHKSAPPSRRPCDLIIWMAHDMQHLTDPQTNMAKGCKTVWEEALPFVKRRGIYVWNF